MKKSWIVCVAVFALLFAITATAKAPETDPKEIYKCWTGTIIVDSDCDGAGDIGVNEDFESLNQCSNWLITEGYQIDRTYECWWYPSPACINTCVADEEPDVS